LKRTLNIFEANFRKFVSQFFSHCHLKIICRYEQQINDRNFTLKVLAVSDKIAKKHH